MINVYACVEIRNGTRLRDDGSYMTNADRKGPQPMPLNDDIWFVEESKPSEWDRRHMGYFAIQVVHRSEAVDAMELAAHNEAAHILRLVWDRTPFTASQLAAIQQRIPDEDTLPPIPTMTFTQFMVATIPCNSAWVKAMAVEARDFHVGRIRIGEELLVTAPAKDRPALQAEIDKDIRFRDSFEAKRIRFAKRLALEESLPRRAEITRG